MKHKLLVLAGLAGLLANPTFATTAKPLPAELSAGLVAARTVDDIAVLVTRQPELATTLMLEAAILGIASPSGVLRAGLGPQSPCAEVKVWVGAAVEAAPREADVSARAAAETVTAATPCVLPTIAIGAVDGLEAARLTADEQAAELRELVATLRAIDPARADAIGTAIAAATDDPDDSAETVLAAANNPIETADIGPPSGLPVTLPDAVQVRTLPSAAANNPSPN